METREDLKHGDEKKGQKKKKEETNGEKEEMGKKIPHCPIRKRGVPCKGESSKHKGAERGS